MWLSCERQVLFHILSVFCVEGKKRVSRSHFYVDAKNCGVKVDLSVIWRFMLGVCDLLYNVV